MEQKVRYAVALYIQGKFNQVVAHDQSHDQAARLARHWNETMPISQRLEGAVYVVTLDQRES